MSDRKRPSADHDVPEGMDDGAGHQLTVGSQEPRGYSLNGPMAALAERLIGGQDDLAQLRPYKIGILRRDTTRTDREFHVDAASKVKVLNDYERAWSGDRFQMVMWLQGQAWDDFAPEQRMAWMHSLLLRFVVKEEGGVTTIRPGVVEFPSIVARYGGWNEQLKLALELDARREGPTMGTPGPRRLSAVPDAPAPVTH